MSLLFQVIAILYAYHKTKYMKIAVLFTVIVSVVFASCAGEKKMSEVPQNTSTSDRYRVAFENNDLLSVPFLLNFHGVSATQDLNDQIYGTMNRSYLFVPDSTLKNKDVKGSIYPLDWAVENKKVKNFLMKHQTDPLSSFYNQECALGMLMKTDLLDSKSKESEIATEEYVKTLLKEGTYSPGIIFHALEKLTERWNHKQLASAAEQAISRRDKFDAEYDNVINQMESKDKKGDLESDLVVTFKLMKQRNDYYVKKLQKISVI